MDPNLSVSLGSEDTDGDTSSDDFSASDLSFVVSDDDEPAPDLPDSDVDSSRSPTPTPADDTEGISTANIVTGRRVRRQTTRYEDQLFRDAEVQKLYMEGASPHHLGSSDDEDDYPGTDHTGVSSEYSDDESDEELTPSDEAYADGPPRRSPEPRRSPARSQVTSHASGSHASHAGHTGYAGHPSHASGSHASYPGKRARSPARGAAPAAKRPSPRKSPGATSRASGPANTTHATAETWADAW